MFLIFFFPSNWKGKCVKEGEKSLKRFDNPQIHAHEKHQLPFGVDSAPQKGINMLGSSNDTSYFWVWLLFTEMLLRSGLKDHFPTSVSSRNAIVSREIMQSPVVCMCLKNTHHFGSALYLKLSSHFTWLKLGFREQLMHVYPELRGITNKEMHEVSDKVCSELQLF